MSIQALIWRLSMTRCVSNQLILKTCQQYYQVSTATDFLLAFVCQHLKTAKHKLFYQRWSQSGSKPPAFLTFFDQAYPQKLRQIYNPPAILYYAGNLALLQNPTVAVIDSRQCNYYTQQIVQGLVPRLVQNKITTISGLARGADSCCHQVTLDYQGMTIAVIGNSLDYFYPAENRDWQKQIQHSGLILSEYPPHTRPRPYYFPQRNRIIAGLCDSLIVTQAKKYSGTLITAELALQENRDVWAVPGPITQSLSYGCNQLIASGARPFLDAETFIQALRAQKNI